MIRGLDFVFVLSLECVSPVTVTGIEYSEVVMMHFPSFYLDCVSIVSFVDREK